MSTVEGQRNGVRAAEMEPQTHTEGTEVNGVEQLLPGGGQQLLPGILDDIALAEIAPKMPWKCLCALESVSPAWRQAMRRREAHDARVRNRTQESLVLIRYDPDFHKIGKKEYNSVLGLYSTRDGLYFELPPLPVCRRGIPDDSQCVTSDGKVYALGGRRLDFRLVYVLDLAGRQRQWTQCASMVSQKTYSFSCTASDGKLYVGGRVPVAEVYDPKADTWSLMKPMASRRREEPSTAVGEAITALNESWFSSRSMLQMVVGEELFEISLGEAFYLEMCWHDLDRFYGYHDGFLVDVYHPVKDEWRVEKFYPRNRPHDSCAILFTSEGRLYRLLDCCISVLDINTKTWILQHECSFAEIEIRDKHTELRDVVRAVAVLGNELVAIAQTDCDNLILQSEGFGGDNLGVTWRTSNFFPSYPDKDWALVEMFPIQL